MNNYKIAASILSADFAGLGSDVERVLAAGADIVHFDVMDNHYVPNLTFGPLVCKALRDYGINAPIDVHLMIKPVDSMIKAFVKAGASSITIHPDATTHLDRSLQLITDLGCKAGVALNPATGLDSLAYVLNKVDTILVMSVNPGFGGQKFIESALDKIKAIKKMIDAQLRDISIQVDGGIKPNNIKKVAEAGADNFVMGSALFGSSDYLATINEVRSALAA
ncbi:MAG: ribulose-phosphate 3-epimerase [Gammaproteobacteria bacterium]|nr:ribulose-phosphate 3-epimerase [Gammaproteobacteria bacterium]